MRGDGNNSAIQMMRRSWRATLVKRYHVCFMAVTDCGHGRPCTLLPATQALVATSRIFVSPLRTISPLTPPRFLREKSSRKSRRIYALRKILNGIGSMAIERLHGLWFRLFGGQGCKTTRPCLNHNVEACTENVNNESIMSESKELFTVTLLSCPRASLALRERDVDMG